MRAAAATVGRAKVLDEVVCPVSPPPPPPPSFGAPTTPIPHSPPPLPSLPILTTPLYPIYKSPPGTMSSSTSPQLASLDLETDGASPWGDERSVNTRSPPLHLPRDDAPKEGINGSYLLAPSPSFPPPNQAGSNTLRFHKRHHHYYYHHHHYHPKHRALPLPCRRPLHHPPQPASPRPPRRPCRSYR